MPIRRLLPSAFALAVLAAYALPLTVGIASQVSHELDHFMGEFRGQEPGTVLELDEISGPSDEGFVHAHGDKAAHAHEGGIAKLLVAAEHAEQQQGEAVHVALELVGHVPAAGAPALFLTADATPAADEPATAATDVSVGPPLPPPRA